jgi:predicted TIM-barrel fold metal-dependent hydrolase
MSFRGNSEVGIVDLMMGLPKGDRRWWAKSMAPLLLDAESLAEFQHAAQYMFKDLPDKPTADGDRRSRAELLIAEMDAYRIDKALIPVTWADQDSIDAVRSHPERLLGCFMVDPNRGMETVRGLIRAYEEIGVLAASFFPCGLVPQVPIDDRKAYPVYAKCVELDIPIFVNAGVPGPRVPMDAQSVARIDEVCWFFPELRVVLRHGAEPWVDLAVKLMIKWPNLYYSTSAFAPKYYPREIIDFANSSRGADRVLYAGYYPSGLSLQRIFSELEDLPLRDEVWPKFLRENALRVLKISASDRTPQPDPAT